MKKSNKEKIIEKSKVLEQFPSIEDIMFKNKSALILQKKKKNYKNKPKY